MTPVRPFTRVVVHRHQADNLRTVTYDKLSDEACDAWTSRRVAAL
jgi:hypothetical protein